MKDRPRRRELNPMDSPSPDQDDPRTETEPNKPRTVNIPSTRMAGADRPGWEANGVARMSDRIQELEARIEDSERRVADAERALFEYRQWVEGSRTLRLARMVGGVWHALVSGRRPAVEQVEATATTPPLPPREGVWVAGSITGLATITGVVNPERPTDVAAIEGLLAHTADATELVLLAEGAGQLPEPWFDHPRVRVLNPTPGSPEDLTPVLVPGESWTLVRDWSRDDLEDWARDAASLRQGIPDLVVTPGDPEGRWNTVRGCLGMLVGGFSPRVAGTLSDRIIADRDTEGPGSMVIDRGAFPVDIPGLEGAVYLDPLAAPLTRPTMLVTSPYRLARIAAAVDSDGLPGVLLVSVSIGDGSESFRHRTDLRRHADVCVATRPDSGEFLGVLHPRVCVTNNLSAALRTIRAGWQLAPSRLTASAASLPNPTRPAKTPRILLQVDKFGSGGLEQALIMFARHLESTGQGHPLVLITEQAPDPAAENLLAEIPWIHLGEGPNREARYRRLLKDEAVSVVNLVYSTFGVDEAVALNIPIVQTIQNTYVWLSGPQLAAFRHADAHTAAYLCVSDRVAWYSWRRIGLSPSKMLTLPNPARVRRQQRAENRPKAREALGLPADPFLFLEVATIYPTKAQLVAVEALADLRRRGANAQLVFVGPTMDLAYRRRIERRVADLNLQEFVTLREHTDSVEDFYAAADAFVLPSHWEGWSLAVNEAASFGLPLVLSRVGAAEEIGDLAGVRLVEVPFDEVDRLDIYRIPDIVNTIDLDYVVRLADAMEETVRKPIGADPEFLSRMVDPAVVLEAYAHVMAWVIQRGHAAGARGWTFAPWRAADDGSMRSMRPVVSAAND